MNGSVNIRVNKVKPNDEYQGVKLSTVKNKLFTPFLSTTVNFSYNNGFTKEYIITAFAEFLKEIGMIGQSGAWCYYPDELKKIIVDNGFNKKIIKIKEQLPTPTKTDENGNIQTLAVDGYKIGEKEEILFDVDKKFYLKDLIDELINNDEFYQTILTISEEFIQKNINNINEKMKDETAVEDETTRITTKKLQQLSTDEATEEMFKSIQEQDIKKDLEKLSESKMFRTMED